MEVRIILFINTRVLVKNKRDILTSRIQHIEPVCLDMSICDAEMGV